MPMIFAVAVGGAVGSVLRYLTMARLATLVGFGFPWGTLAVNIVGSFLMGVLVEAGARAWQPSPELRAFLAVGILGGYTTFSTFSMDVALLIERNQLLEAFGYVAASILLGVGALFLAMALVRQVM